MNDDDDDETSSVTTIQSDDTPYASVIASQTLRHINTEQ